MKVVITNTQHDEQVIRAAIRFAAQVVKTSYPEWKHDKLLVKVKNHKGPYWRGMAYSHINSWTADGRDGWRQLVTMGIGKCLPISRKSIGSLNTVIESIIFLAAHEFDHSARQYIRGNGKGEELANWQGRHAVVQWRKAQSPQ